MLRERLEEAPTRLSRRVLLGGGAATGAALATGGVSTARAAPITYLVLDKRDNVGPTPYPTGIRGLIEAPTGDPLDLFTAAFEAKNDNATAGCGLLGFGYSVGVNALSPGIATFAKSDGGGIGVHGWVYGGPASSSFSSGVWGQSSIDDAPAFMSDAKITLRTWDNEGGIPENGDAKPGDLSIRTDGSGGSTWWVCIKEAGRDPAEFVRVASPGAAGAFDVLPAPIRVYDSRDGAPPTTGPKTPLVGPENRTESCVENTGGAVPADARAVVVNLTATGTSAAGFAAVFPTGGVWGGTSNLNFAAGQTIANSVTVGCGTGASIDVHIGEAGVSANIIVDVMGFYR